MTARISPLLGVFSAALLCAASASASTPGLRGKGDLALPPAEGGTPHPTSASPLDRAPELVTFKLGDAARLSLLRAYFDAEIERPGPYNRYVGGQYGRWSRQPWISLAWGGEPRDASPEIGPDDPDPSELVALPVLANDHDELRVRIDPQDWTTRLFVADDPATDERSALAENDPLPRAPFWTTGPSLASNGFDRLWAPVAKPVNDWRCRRRPVLFIRHGGENDRVSLVQCGGAVELGAVDRLSILARPPEVPPPGELPDEPDPSAWEASGEWLPRVKLVNPRLVWLLQKIADAFPHRAIYIYSGYRPHKDKSVVQGHHSMHGDGRAMDIQIHGVRNEALFGYCRKLDDVGCGFYPNSKFVHVDVRKPGTGHAFWIDTSGPGEPSHYVDSWPGVVDHGALAWMVVPAKERTVQGPRPRTPDDRGTADVIRK